MLMAIARPWRSLGPWRMAVWSTALGLRFGLRGESPPKRSYYPTGRHFLQSYLFYHLAWRFGDFESGV